MIRIRVRPFGFRSGVQVPTRREAAAVRRCLVKARTKRSFEVHLMRFRRLYEPALTLRRSTAGSTTARARWGPGGACVRGGGPRVDAGARVWLAVAPFHGGLGLCAHRGLLTCAACHCGVRRGARVGDLVVVLPASPCTPLAPPLKPTGSACAACGHPSCTGSVPRRPCLA